MRSPNIKIEPVFDGVHRLSLPGASPVPMGPHNSPHTHPSPAPHKPHNTPDHSSPHAPEPSSSCSRTCTNTITISLPAPSPLEPARNLFAARGWLPFPFQIEAWSAYLQGHSGLINAPTGVGKTLSAALGPMLEALHAPHGRRSVDYPPPPSHRRALAHAEPLRLLWLTPLRALASDTTNALLETVRALSLPWTVQLRTSDTSQSVRAKQKERLPSILVTTPESLSLLLSYPDARHRFASLACVVCDEWHELMSSKRGVQTELALARLRAWNPDLRTWGLSATLGNLEQARDVLLGPDHPPARARLIRADHPKALEIATLIPADIERFPWAGHLGIRLLDKVADAVARGDPAGAGATLLFTNTRSQAEIWFSRLLHAREDLAGLLAIHHGSLDRSLRARVESMLAAGRLRCVVCTSSLDLGVDFQPVDQVLQLGSPKGVARLLQRAGRSGHRPGAVSRVLGVPTNAFELVEFAAARDAALAGNIESRPPIERPLDVLVQHLVTIACGGGFVESDLRHEVRSTHAFRALSDTEWDWCMDFVRRGGQSLSAYPSFERIALRNGRFVVASDRTARAHRLSIGTITGESSLIVKYLSGGSLGHIEDNFIARIVPGDRFTFAGRILELVRVRGNVVFVRRSRKKHGLVPRWDGGRFSLSSQLARAVRVRLDAARRGVFDGPELTALRPLLELQMRWSALPAPDELLIELIDTRDAFNLLLYPFAGRTAHEGLGALLSARLAALAPATITSTCNDYGLCLASSAPIPLNPAQLPDLLRDDDLLDELSRCINSGLLARRQFRDIARIAGLVVPGYPGAPKTARHLQASSEMFFDVFEEFDADNLLLTQAKREVLDNQLEVRRLRDALAAMRAARPLVLRPACLTPLAFPIWTERLRANSVSSERFEDAVARMVVELEARAAEPGYARAAGAPPPAPARSRSRARNRVGA